jgi:hypothetical protein
MSEVTQPPKPKSAFVSARFPVVPYLYPPKNIFILHVESKYWLRVPANTGDIKTIHDLKEFVKKHLELQNEFKITLGGVTLDKDDEHFDRFLIHNKPWLIPKPSQHKGLTRAIDFKFSKMGDSFKEQEFKKTSLEWRKAKRGLCVEGYCMNKQCKAYFPESKSLVVMPMGYGEFDMVYDGAKCKCPVCGESVAPRTCAINNCKWKYTGTKAKQAEKPEDSEWKEVGNTYAKFSDAEQDQTDWIRLIIQTKEITFSADEAAICDLCVEDFSHGTKRRTKCGHLFHDFCLSDWKKGSSNCPNCREAL